MNPIPLNLAVEDFLSEAVCRRMLEHTSRPFHVGTVFGRGGFGYLKRLANGWNASAVGVPILLLTDLDLTVCAPTLISSWLSQPPHPNMLFRVAVREVEAWLMGDKAGFASFLKVKEQKLPDYPETLIDPKRELLTLAEGSGSREIRKRLLPKPGSSAKQGPDYTGALTEYVRSIWSPSVAAEACPSLKRCLYRLGNFDPTWT